MIFFLGSALTSTINAKTIYWNKGRGYRPFNYSTRDGILIDNRTDTLEYDYYSLSESTKDFSLTFRAKNLNGHPTKKYEYENSYGKKFHISNPQWGFFITTERDTLLVKLNGGEKMTATDPVPSLDISFYNFAIQKSHLIKESLTDGFNPYTGDNLWKIIVAKDRFIINGGDKSLKNILEIPMSASVTGFGFYAGWGEKLLISDIAVSFSTKEEEPEVISIVDLNAHFQNSGDEMEGYWTIFDRELEESLLKLGGFYNLMCLKDEDCYKFYYYNGATVNSKEWKEGDLKAIFRASPFPGIYDVEWYDSMKEPLTHDIKAQKGEGNTLSIQFPYQSSRLRMRKMPVGFMNRKTN